MKKLSISKIFAPIKQIPVGRYSPEILTGIGVGGMFVMAVMAVHATPKALARIEEKKEELGVEKLGAVETVKTAGTCYIPAAVVAVLSTGCIIGASSVNLKRRAALATAYTLSESALKEYQAKTLDVIGEKKEREIRDEIAKDKVEKNPPVSSEVIVTNAGKTLFYDSMSDRYFMSNIEKIRRIENTMNYRMRQENYVSVNDLYYELGLRGTANGDDLGWNIDHGEIRIDFSTQLITDEESIYYGQPCIVIGFDYFAPRSDYRHLM